LEAVKEHRQGTETKTTTKTETENMAQLREICGTKYIEDLQSIDGLEDTIGANIYTYGKKKADIMNDYLEGYATARIDGIIGLYYSAGILDIEQLLDFDIARCFREE